MEYKQKTALQLWMHLLVEAKTTVVTFLQSIFYHIQIQDNSNLEKLITVNHATQNSERMSEKTITLVSWNIFKSYYPEKINKSINFLSTTHKPDLWVLQEAHPSLASEQSHANYVSSHKFNESHNYSPFSHSGQLTHSRFAHSSSEVHLLPQVTNYSSWSRSTEFLHRVFLYTQITTQSNKTIGVYNIHLENMTTPRGRLHQINHILDIYKQKNDDYVIMAGDYNAFFTKHFESLFKKLDEQGFVNFADPHWRLTPQLDFVYSKGFKSGEITIVPVNGSDHNPVLAKLEL